MDTIFPGPLGNHDPRLALKDNGLWEYATFRGFRACRRPLGHNLRTHLDVCRLHVEATRWRDGPETGFRSSKRTSRESANPPLTRPPFVLLCLRHDFQPCGRPALESGRAARIPYAS
jgi:hypothetical protein